MYILIVRQQYTNNSTMRSDINEISIKIDKIALLYLPDVIKKYI